MKTTPYTTGVSIYEVYGGVRQFKSSSLRYWDILGESVVNWSCLHEVRRIFNLDLESKHSFAAIVNELFYKTFKYVVKYLKPLNMHALKS